MSDGGVNEEESFLGFRRGEWCMRKTRGSRHLTIQK